MEGVDKEAVPRVKNRDPLIFRRAFDMARSSEIFTALSERRGGLELSRRRSQRQDSFGHEPALVARSRSAAKLLLGFFKFVGIPRCNDHRRCHPCCWHSQGGPAALASCRTSEQLRRLEVLTSHRCRSRASTCVFRPRFDYSSRVTVPSVMRNGTRSPLPTRADRTPVGPHTQSMYQIALSRRRGWDSPEGWPMRAPNPR